MYTSLINYICLKTDFKTYAHAPMIKPINEGMKQCEKLILERIQWYEYPDE